MLKSRIITSLLDLIYPPTCKVCGGVLFEGEEEICLKCLKNIPLARLSYGEDNFADRLFWGIVEFEKVMALMNYTKGSDYTRLLLSLKYWGDKELGLRLGHLMALLLPKAFFESIDYIIPVPLHRSKLKSRGYNQAEWLAKGIQEIYPLPLLPDGLIKTSSTASQTTKSVVDRRDTLKGLFVVNSSYELRGRHILLVDDVLTTGSTLIACREALNAISPLKVSALTFAITRD